MPLISTIGRRSPRARLLMLAIAAFLVVGAVTMVYPFALMISGSTKSAIDTPDTDLVPRFLTDTRALWCKHVEGLFNESLESMRYVFDSDALTFDGAPLPSRPNQALVDAWLDFLREFDPPHYYYTIGYVYAPVSRGVVPKAVRDFKQELVDRFDNDIAALNVTLDTEFTDWRALYVLPEKLHSRSDRISRTRMADAYRAFKASQPLSNRHCFSVEGFFKYQYIQAQYGRDIAEYNKGHGTHYGSYAELHLDRRLPTGPDRSDAERKDWEEFVRNVLNLLWLRADADAAPQYRRFLQAKYGDIATFNRNYGTNYGSFDEVPILSDPETEDLPLSDWDAFVQGWRDPDTNEIHILPADKIRIHSMEFLFRDHLKKRYAGVQDANAALGTSFANWMDVLPPQLDAQYLSFKQKLGTLRWEFSTRNYLTVFDHIILRGRAMLNTAIYCSLAVLGALVVNPLAAYALSRYKPPSSYKVLLFLMLTMTFPPMVTQIPAFLMLREFNLLNTFWALILPGLANGYWIFLLKAFFDSLPRELYESASLDGAGEFRMLWHITMSLSKPVLAVVALNAFTGAYSNFMFALIVCQDQKMWTLMVWLFQLQGASGPGVVYASLIIAAIPTFLAFVLCQKVIMRGIVVPVEK